MGVVTTEHQVESPIPPAKLFKAFFLDAHINLPKILPQFVKSIEFIEGDGGAGSLNLTTFGEESRSKYAKNRIEVVDKENFIYNYSTIEGDPWVEGLDKASHESKMEASPSGGSIVKSINKYYPKGDGQIDMDKIKAIEDNVFATFKAVEAHILANPDAY